MKRVLSAMVAVLLFALCLPARADSGATYTEYTTMAGATAGVRSNIEQAIGAINGTYVPYGGSFSFNDVVGPRTKAYGYVSGENGRGVDVIGGGVAQVATTLYLALLDIPGIVYTEVDTYGSDFTGDYVSDGALAVVTDYSAGDDFKFENYEDDMTIYMWTDEDYCYCTIEVGSTSAWSDDDGYTLVASASFELDGTDGLKNNVGRAADSVSGVLLASGDAFSFNDLVGPRTEEYGYVSALNGRGVSVIGGGVAQVASVVWLAVEQLDDITMIEKSTYGNNYSQSYVASSSDAIVTDYNAGTDFSFRYAGEGLHAIYVYVDGGYLNCDVYESGGLSW
jgi:vancomycin resistance protein YoaR